VSNSTNNVVARLRLTGQRAFSAGMRQVTDDSSKARRGFSKIGGAAKTMSKNVGGAAVALGTFGVAAAAGLGAKFIQDAEESRKVGKLTEAVIKSTGKAAKVSAKHVGDLAGAISNKTGVDDEAIQSGANMLLTFTRIRNEAGKGNDIFDRATQTITDMGAAMGKDPVKSSVMLGKALNDPVKGVTALSKVGVTFDAQQKKQIERYVKQGKLAKAQGVILDELAKEFGGAAAAQGSATDKLRVQFGNLSEDIGTALLPYVDRFSTWMGSKGVPLIERTATGLGRKLFPAVKWVVGAVRDGASTLSRWWKLTAPNRAKAGAEVMFRIRRGVRALSESLERNGPFLKNLVSGFKEFAVQHGPAISRFIGKLAGWSAEGLIRGVGLAIDGFRAITQFVSKFGRTTINVFGDILHGAAKAFGWVPGIGPKLKAADKDFKGFRERANTEFDKIDAAIAPKLATDKFDRQLTAWQKQLVAGDPNFIGPVAAGSAVDTNRRRRDGTFIGPVAPSTLSAGRTIVVPAPRTDVTVTMDGANVAQKVTTRQQRATKRR